MSFNKVATGAAFALGLALLSWSAAHANVMLNYTGNNFTDFVRFNYNASDKVTASITLANSLGDNQNLVSVTPLAFSLSDDLQTISNTSPAVSGSFEFSTDPKGDITMWSVDVTSRLIVGGISREVFEIFTKNTISGVEDLGSITTPTSLDQGSNQNMPGTWVATTPAVPEPSTLSLLGASLLGFGLLWWRRPQNRDLDQ